MMTDLSNVARAKKELDAAEAEYQRIDNEYYAMKRKAAPLPLDKNDPAVRRIQKDRDDALAKQMDALKRYEAAKGEAQDNG